MPSPRGSLPAYGHEATQLVFASAVCFLTDPKFQEREMSQRTSAAIMLGFMGCLMASMANAQGFGPRPEGDEDFQRNRSGSKLCSAYSNVPQFRDTIQVPDTWTAQDCMVFAKSFGPTIDIQLGCIFSGDPPLSWGGVGGGIPRPDCGWGRDRGERPRRGRRFREDSVDEQDFDGPGRFERR